MVSGGTAYPGSSYSYLTVSDPNVLLWSLKPAEEGIGEGVIARLWNLTASPKSFSISLNEPIARAKSVTHIETDRGDATVSAGTRHRDRGAEPAPVVPALPVVARPFGEDPAVRLAHDRGRRQRLVHGRPHRRPLAAAQRSVHGRRCRDARVRLRGALRDGDDSGRSELGGDHAQASRRLRRRIAGGDHRHAHLSAGVPPRTVEERDCSDRRQHRRTGGPRARPGSIRSARARAERRQTSPATATTERSRQRRGSQASTARGFSSTARRRSCRSRTPARWTSARPAPSRPG